MPASDRKVEANRRNAQRSTGPRSEAGKARTRANALKHGLSGDGIVTTSTEAEEVAKQMEAWRPGFQVDTPMKEWALEQLAVSLVRIKMCQNEERLVRQYEKERALLSWEQDQAADAAALGDRLRRKPELVASQLMQSKYGCEWLLKQWGGLKDVLDAGELWNDDQLQLAFDLTGIPRHGREVLAPFEDPAGLVENTCQDLSDFIEISYEYLNERERTSAEAGFPEKPSKRIALLRRYEAACMKRFLEAQEMLGPPVSGTEQIAEKPPKIVEESGPPAPPELDPFSPKIEAEMARGSAYAEYETARQAAPEAERAALAPNLPSLTAPAPCLRDAAPPTAASAARPMNRKQRKALARRAANGK
jgi:hypothetical protein